ncbi:MAG: helix-turn-helix transcriptional regulator [Bacteroidota bacterium]
MQIDLTIRQDLTQLQQIAAQFGVQPTHNTIEIPAVLGEGYCRLYRLPYQIQLHHYKYCLNREIEVRSINKPDDGMYIVNVNLSKKLLNTRIGDADRWLSKEGETGVLYYSPGTNSSGKNEIGLPFELIFFSIPTATIATFREQMKLDIEEWEHPFCHYAELGDALTEELHQVLRPRQEVNIFLQQGKLMEILGKILSIFYEQKWHGQHPGLKMADVEKLLAVKNELISHIFGAAPTIPELAEQCGMSPSQLKTKFKSLFGKSIYQYYLTSKLNIARKMISQREGTVAEIGYRLGYSNISQFSAQFKKHFGISPSQVNS